MTTSESEAHSRVVVSLQALLSKHRPGSSPHRIAERALDLAFNGSRSRGGDLKLELLQDAEQTIGRQVEAKLLDGLADTSSTTSIARLVGTRTFAPGLPLRHSVIGRLLQVEIRLTIEERNGDGHARLC